MATSFYQVKNNAKTTITNNPLSAGGLSITLASSTGSRFPTTGNTWLATIWDAVTYADPSDDPNMEVVKIDSRSTDTLTVNASGRGFAGTTGVAHATGSAIRLLVMKEHVDQITTAVTTLENASVGTYTAWTAYTATITGFSGTPTQSCKYSQIGKMVFVHLFSQGTSNATGFTITLPIAPSISGTSPIYFNIGRQANNGALDASPGMAQVFDANTTVTLFRDGAGTTWTASNEKYAYVSFFYPVA